MLEGLTICENQDIKHKAFEICGKYLGGLWQIARISDIKVKVLQGGLCNDLYYCSIDSHDTKDENSYEPKEIILRLFGPHRSVDQIERPVLDESVILMKLSERQLGPKIYGVFPDGRLEGFIHGRTLNIEDWQNPQISSAIARKSATIHCLEMPIKKQPCFHDIFMRYLSCARKEIAVNPIINEDKEIADFVLSHDLEAEFQWMIKTLSISNSPVVFCHNDLRNANIYLEDNENKSIDDRMIFLDFEYSTYNYRGYEFADMFYQCSLQFSTSHPYFKIIEENYPTEEQQLFFIESYLSYLKEHPCSKNPFRTKEEIMEEISLFRLAPHLFAVIWCIYSALKSTTKYFGYWEYCKFALEKYFQEKKKLLDKMQKNGLTN